MHSLAHVVPAALTELLQSMPLSAGKVAFAWRAAVGPALERATAVTLQGSVLIVEAPNAEWAREVRRSSGVILVRLRTLLGPHAVQRIEVRIIASRTRTPEP